MKKLLSLLSVVTMTGTSIPSVIAASPYTYKQKQVILENKKVNYLQTNILETLNRNKRGVNDGNEFVGWNPLYASFKPNLWEEIIIIKYESGNSLSSFQKKFKEKVKAYYYANKFDIWNFFISFDTIDTFSKLIFNDWDRVNSYWRNSIKRERIRIVTDLNTGKVYDVKIRTDDKNYYENKYLNNQIISEVLINTNLGELFNINQQTILDSIKLKNSNIDISHLSVSDITNKSAKITVISSGKYTKGTSVNVYFKKQNLIDLNNIIFKCNLKINNNIDNTILNELNYLNPKLDISQLEVINKTNISAAIKAKSNSTKYFGEKKIYYMINNQQNKIINLNELIKKAIFLRFKTKSEENIDMSNLMYSDIRLKPNNIIIKNTEEEVIDNIGMEFPVLNHTQTYNSPKWKYSKESIEKFKITKGLKIEETSSKKTDKKHDWKIESDFDLKAELNKFTKLLLDLSANLKLHGEITDNYSSSETITLSKNFDLSSKEIEINKNFKEIEFPSQPVKIFSNEHKRVDLITFKNNYEISKDLEQKIYGKISIRIIKNNKEKTIELSIKEAMQILQEYNLLPQEITINNDDSITFNGKMLLSKLESGLNAKLSVTEILKNNIDQKSITSTKNIKSTQNDININNNQYNVPGDGSCLFWSVATAYLLPIRNNNEEFRTRFIQLFGKENLKYLQIIQKLLQQFDLENHSNNQLWYNDEIAIRLVTNVFRNSVVDYIQSHLDTISTHNGELTFRDLIQENNEIASNYLEGMRELSTWGGVSEIIAITNILNASISVDNADSYQPINQNSSNTINLFHVNNRTHYNFALLEKVEVSNTNSQEKNTTIKNQSSNNNNANMSNKKGGGQPQLHSIDSIVNKYNTLSKEEKQQKLNEINQHYQNLSENDKKVFKDKLRNIGLGLTSTGISGAGILGISKMTGISPIKGLSTTANYIKNSLSSTNTAVSTGTGEAMEMTPLLSESTVAESLTAAETLSVAEGTAVVATEGAVIGTEAGTAAALAPETLGLSLLIGGLAIAGTAIIWWLSNHDNNSQSVKHESHNQYNEIEKYYKFLAHDQLKLDITINEWNKIKQIYQENSNNYQEFKNKIKSEITNFHKEDHSGWGGSLTDNDINTLINIIYNHFQEINNHFSSNPNHGWKIVTNTIGSYFIIEEE